MRVAVGSDHAGYDLKEGLRAELVARGHDVTDLGTHDAVMSLDYPDYGAAAGRAVVDGEAELDVCVCGSGIGISIAANGIESRARNHGTGGVKDCWTDRHGSSIRSTVSSAVRSLASFQRWTKL